MELEFPCKARIWARENRHYAMPGGYGATPEEHLDGLYTKLCAHDQSADVPSASALTNAGISVSTHGRVNIKGKIARGTQNGSGWRVTIGGEKLCVNKLTKRVWLTPPHTTDLKYELWSYAA